MDILTTKFQELWKDFISSFKGNLITESHKYTVQFPVVKMTLSEALLTWTSEYTINGRWLYKLIQENPEKGCLVKRIITKDIALEEIKSTSIKNSDSLKYIIPIGAGAVGYGIAHLTELATIGTACATIAPMAIAYPVAKKYLSNQNEKAQINLINSYVNQLNKYKESLLSVLMT